MSEFGRFRPEPKEIYDKNKPEDPQLHESFRPRHRQTEEVARRSNPENVKPGDAKAFQQGTMTTTPNDSGAGQTQTQSDQNQQQSDQAQQGTDNAKKDAEDYAKKDKEAYDRALAEIKRIDAQQKMNSSHQT